MTLFPLLRLDSFYPAYLTAGGVLDYLTFHTDKSHAEDEIANHRQAAVSAIKILTDTVNLGGQTSFRSGDLETMPDPWKLYPEHATGRKISWAEFIGTPGGEGRTQMGYRELFLDPPHGLRLTKEQCEQLLEQSYRALIPSKSHPIVIYSWTTDWADYFRDGLEWWGTALWTITSDYGDSIIVIAASSTD